MKLRSLFNLVAKKASYAAGTPWTFLAAVTIVVVWALSGPIFRFNDTWQLVINTSTTIITFLMVFLIQNTQNRDNDELHIKVDELLRTTQRAHKALLDLEDMGPAELHALRKQYQQLGEHDQAAPGNDAPAKDTPD